MIDDRLRVTRLNSHRTTQALAGVPVIAFEEMP